MSNKEIRLSTVKSYFNEVGLKTRTDNVTKDQLIKQVVSKIRELKKDVEWATRNPHLMEFYDEYSSKSKGHQFKSDKFWIKRSLVASKAFMSLTASAMNVFWRFRLKCKEVPPKKKPRPGEDWIISNNGKLVFTYQEAVKKLNISKGTFRNAIDNLVETGFIDITHPGGGTDGNYSKYAMSDRWQKFGTEEFKYRIRPKDDRLTNRFDTVNQKKEKVVEPEPTKTMRKKSKVVEIKKHKEKILNRRKPKTQKTRRRAGENKV